MSRKFAVAVIGATGVVGGEMLSILAERKFPCESVRVFASEKSVGETVAYADEELEIEALAGASFEGIDVALFASGAAISAEYAPMFAEAGAWVIDNSSHFRMQEGIPLVVPEVNAHVLSRESKIIANPNCSTIQLMPILKVLEDMAGLTRVVVSTYQAVSGAGKQALDELFEQTRGVFNQKDTSPEAFLHPIAFNCIPQIDVFLENGYTKEEFKIINESRKILQLADLRITATAVRVPVFHCHGESVNVELQRECSVEDFIRELEQREGVQVSVVDSEYPMQQPCGGTDDIYVGRVRKDTSVTHGLDFWVVADNLRKGAALNAIQIAETLIEKALLD